MVLTGKDNAIDVIAQMLPGKESPVDANRCGLAGKASAPAAIANCLRGRLSAMGRTHFLLPASRPTLRRPPRPLYSDGTMLSPSNVEWKG